MKTNRALSIGAVVAPALTGTCSAQTDANDRRLLLPSTTHVAHASMPPYVRDLELSDIDRDGRDEAVVATPSGIDIWGLDPLNASRFVLELSFDFGSPVWVVRVADLDGNGWDDIAYGFAPHTVEHWDRVFTLFRTEAGFTPGPELVGAGSILDLETGDYNADGITDLVASPNIVFPGLGDGQFGEGLAIAGVLLGTGMRVADFDQDGRDDVLASDIVRSCAAVSFSSDPPEFDVAWIDGPSVPAHGAAVGDYNGDAYPDVAFLGRQDADSAFGSLRVHLNTGDGTFDALPPIPLGYRVDRVARLEAADFDGDGFDDLAAVLESAPVDPHAFVCVLYGNASGVVSDERLLIDTAFRASVVRAGDVDGDGRRDVVSISAPDNGASLGVFRNLGGRVFETTRGEAMPDPDGSGPVTLVAPTVAADVTGDGRADLIQAKEVLRIYENRAGHRITTLDLVSTLDFGAPVVSHDAADLNGDGIDDLAISVESETPVWVCIATGGGSFLPPVNWPVPFCEAIRLADVDGNGTADVVAFDNSDELAPHVHVGLNDGDGSVGPAISSRLARRLDGRNLELCDVTGDGLLDIVGVDEERRLVRFASDGPGSFERSPVFIDQTFAVSPMNVIAGDYNGDGATDLAYNRMNSLGEIRFLLRFNNGDGTFTLPHILDGWPFVPIRVSSDFNRDGLDDLLGPRAQTVASDGAGGFEATPPSSPDFFTDALVADFNADGVPDIYDDDGRIYFNIDPNATPPCPADCDASGAVDFNDLVAMLFEFGNPDPSDACDADQSGAVDFNDLVTALFLFGACP